LTAVIAIFEVNLLISTLEPIAKKVLKNTLPVIEPKPPLVLSIKIDKHFLGFLLLMSSFYLL